MTLFLFICLLHTSAALNPIFKKPNFSSSGLFEVELNLKQGTVAAFGDFNSDQLYVSV